MTAPKIRKYERQGQVNSNPGMTARALPPAPPVVTRPLPSGTAPRSTTVHQRDQSQYTVQHPRPVVQAVNASIERARAALLDQAIRAQHALRAASPAYQAGVALTEGAAQKDTIPAPTGQVILPPMGGPMQMFPPQEWRGGLAVNRGTQSVPVPQGPPIPGAMPLPEGNVASVQGPFPFIPGAVGGREGGTRTFPVPDINDPRAVNQYEFGPAYPPADPTAGERQRRLVEELTRRRAR